MSALNHDSAVLRPDVGRNLVLSVLLHFMVISVIGGGLLRGASTSLPPAVSKVYLFTEDEAQRPAGVKSQAVTAPQYKTPLAMPPVPRPAETIRPDKARASAAPVVPRLPSSPGETAAEKQGGAEQAVTKDTGTTGIPSRPAGTAASGPAADSGSPANATGGAPAPQPGAALKGRADLVSLIHAAIFRAKYYPLMAKKRGIEGTATVQFMVNSKGYPENIRVNRSSGWEILDSAATVTVEKAAPFPVLEGTLEVPISFRINEDKQRY